jgi:hypothetical protein
MFRHLLSRPRKIARPSPASGPRCEALEPRLLLTTGAGDVTAALVGGNLYITGDDLGNYINVKSGGAGNLVTVDGTGTTVNGSSADWTTPTGVTGNIIIRMNGGNDTLLVQNFTAPKTLTADMGEGQNTLTATNMEWKGLATLQSGDGLDTFTLNQITADNNVSILGGGGGSTLTLNAGEFARNLSVTNDSGGQMDIFAATDTVIHGNLSVNNGDGGSTFGFSVNTGTAAIDGNVSIVDGEGSDYVNFGGAILGRNLSCDLGLGSGDHGLTLGGTTVARSVTYHSLDGMGFVNVADSTVGGTLRVNSLRSQEFLGIDTDSTVHGKVKMTTYAGTNSLQISGGTVDGNVSVTSASQGDIDISDGAWVKGNVAFTSHTGLDQFRASGAKISGNIRVDSGTGGSQFNADTGALLVRNVKISSTSGNAMVAFNDVSVMGVTNVNLGSGQDTVAINDTGFHGLVTINTGSGYDNLSVEEGGTTSGPTTIFFKGLRANTGAGDDLVVLGQNSIAGRAVDFRVASRIDGGPDTDTLSALHLAAGSLTPVVVNFELPI